MMTILITLEPGITMTVKDVEEYIISKEGVFVKIKGSEMKRLFSGNRSVLVKRIK